jgi:hypothetical protein
VFLPHLIPQDPSKRYDQKIFLYGFAFKNKLKKQRIPFCPSTTASLSSRLFIAKDNEDLAVVKKKENNSCQPD